jgi:hypothetical protein
MLSLERLLAYLCSCNNSEEIVYPSTSRGYWQAKVWAYRRATPP